MASADSKMDTNDIAVEAAKSGSMNNLLYALVLLAVLYWGRDSIPFLSSGPKKAKVGAGAGDAGKSKGEADDPDDFVFKMKEGDKKLGVFYGSESGTANEYALRFAKEARSRFGFSSLVMDPEEFEFSTLDKVPSDRVIVFIMATYGDGEPTANAQEFWKFISDPDVEFSGGDNRLDNLNYVIFGLGNTTYEHFNEVARALDRRLQELGAERIGARGETDEITGTEAGYLAWKDGMWDAMAERFGIEEGAAADVADFEVTEIDNSLLQNKIYHGELSQAALRAAHGEIPHNAGTFDGKNPYTAPVTVARELFAVDGERNCVHLEFDISGTNLSYQHGDHLAIWPSNPDIGTERILRVLGLADKRHQAVDIKALDPALAQVPFPTPATYEGVFRHYLEITAPASRQTLALLAKYGPTPEAKAMFERWGSDPVAYHNEVELPRIRIGEALQLATGNDPNDPTDATPWPIPFDRIISMVPRQKPRYYSISSSSKLHPTSIHATAVVLKYDTPKSALHGDQPRWIYGNGTNFLLNIQAAKRGDSSVQHGVLTKAAIRLEDMPNLPLSYRISGPRDNHIRGSDLHIPIHTRSSNFRLPSRPVIPVIMVGPGTGVAPFRGFVQERVALARQTKQRKGEAALKDWAPMWLFYGCRKSNEDFLYQEEWPEYAKELDGKFIMHTAESRGPNRKPDGSKVYVQDMIWDQRDLLAPAICDQNAQIFICGDAKHMAKSVEDTFARMIAEYKGVDGHDAVKKLKDAKRFKTDVWS